MTTPTLAIDPGIANTGFAFWNPRDKTVTLGTTTTAAEMPLGMRIEAVMGCLAQATAYQYSSRIDVLAEDFVGSFGKATILLLGAIYGEYGTTKRVHPRRWVKDLWGPPSNKFVTASKFYKHRAVQLAAREKMHCATQHEADAFALLYWKSLNLEGSYE